MTTPSMPNQADEHTNSTHEEHKPMSKHTVLAAALLSSTILSAHAQQAHAQQPLTVYNSKGDSIGALISDALVAVDINNALYALYFTKQGLTSNTNWYYTTTNCTGTRYISKTPNYDPLPISAIYEDKPAPGSNGRAVWVADPKATPTTITVRSLWYENPPWVSSPGYASCDWINPYNYQNMVPLVAIDTNTSSWNSPPFCVGDDNHTCNPHFAKR